MTRHAVSVTLAALVLATAAVFSFVGATPASADSTITFVGGGFGHGVGMSQYGAYGMATLDGASASTILTHYYTGTVVQPAGQAGGLRVLIANGIGGSTFTGSGTVNFVVNGQIVAAAAPGQPFSIGAESGGIRLCCPGGPFVPPGVTLQIQYAPAPVRVTGTQCGGGCRYNRGLIVARNTGSALMLTVETLSMQDYLYGLGEVPSSWPSAALQAQAIAGRTYANYFTFTRRASGLAQSRGYDLDASTADQFYIGFEKEGEPNFGQFWVGAVDSTVDQSVLYNGASIQAFYFSSSGGYTENSENVFSAALPYLRGVPDPRDQNNANPNFRWSRTYTISQLSSWLSRAGDTNVGTVTAIGINPGPSVSGRIDKGTVTITGSAGTKQVSGSRFRTVVNAGVAGDGGGLSQQFLSTLISTDPTADLLGSLDSVQRVPGGLQVAGWAADKDTSNPIDVHVYVDGNGYVLGPASLNRPDVGAAFPALGPNHGFVATVPASAGTHQVCAWAINTANGAGFNKPVGCRTVTVSVDPFGSLDLGSRSGTGVRVAGWTIDPDTASPIAVHVYVDGAFAAAAATGAGRGDVGSMYPAYGPNHGFDTTVGNFGPGPHTVCVYGINDVQPGTNPQLGCQATKGDPFGSLDVAVRSGAGVRVAGWTIDPDTASPIAVHVYVDGAFAGAAFAAAGRADVGSAFPAYGPNHAFDATVGNFGPGPHTVCVYGINDVQPGTNPTVGCASFS